MRYLFSIVLLQFTFVVYTQEFKVIDAQDKEPVPFATIILKKGSENVYAEYADEKGAVKLSGTPAYDFAVITCVGYKTYMLPREELKGTIHLEQDVVLLDEVVLTTGKPTILGEYYAKQKKYLTLNKQYIASCYFQNTLGGRPVVQSIFFKVDKVYQKTAVRIHLYSRHDYTQSSYHPETNEKSSYQTFIPGEELLLDNLIYYIEPGAKREVEIDLSEYDVEMPAEGLFAAIECLGYYDDSNKLTDAAIKPTKIEMHYTDTDNYAGMFIKHNSWRNINRWIKHDFEMVIKATPGKKSLLAPTFGLEVLTP
jgi:hypothetical protein